MTPDSLVQETTQRKRRNLLFPNHFVQPYVLKQEYHLTWQKESGLKSIGTWEMTRSKPRGGSYFLVHELLYVPSKTPGSNDLSKPYLKIGQQHQLQHQIDCWPSKAEWHSSQCSLAISEYPPSNLAEIEILHALKNIHYRKPSGTLSSIVSHLLTIDYRKSSKAPNSAVS